MRKGVVSICALLATVTFATAVELPPLEAGFPKNWERRRELLCVNDDTEIRLTFFVSKTGDGRTITLIEKDGVRVSQEIVDKLQLHSRSQFINNGVVVTFEGSPESFDKLKYKEVFQRAIGPSDKYMSCYG